MALHSPVEFAQIVDTYIDGWRKNGWMPECRANNLPGWTQGGSSSSVVPGSCLTSRPISFCTGSSADTIVSHFAVYYHNEASRLGIDLKELYSALVTDGEVNPPEWNTQSRQVNVYKSVAVSFDILRQMVNGVLGSTVTFPSPFWMYPAPVDKTEKRVELLR